MTKIKIGQIWFKTTDIALYTEIRIDKICSDGYSDCWNIKSITDSSGQPSSAVYKHMSESRIRARYIMCPVRSPR